MTYCSIKIYIKSHGAILISSFDIFDEINDIEKYVNVFIGNFTCCVWTELL